MGDIVNWNVELKRLERELDGLPPQPSAAAVKARREADRRAQERQDARSAAMGAWARLLLVGALAGGMASWPYPRQCGVGLFAYVFAGVVIGAGSLWVVTLTWRWRMPRTHALALMMVLVSLVLVGAQVLPRVGYARVDPASPAHWRCRPVAP